MMRITHIVLAILLVSVTLVTNGQSDTLHVLNANSSFGAVTLKYDTLFFIKTPNGNLNPKERAATPEEKSTPSEKSKKETKPKKKVVKTLKKTTKTKE